MSGSFRYIISLVAMSKFSKFLKRGPLTEASSEARLTDASPLADTLPSSSKVSNDRKFEQKIASVYAELAEKQSPLEREFAAVWDENTEQLYES